MDLISLLSNSVFKIFYFLIFKVTIVSLFLKLVIFYQASVITLYTMYLTWSAMTNTAENECKPDWDTLIEGSGPTDAPKVIPKDIYMT